MQGRGGAFTAAHCSFIRACSPCLPTFRFWSSPRRRRCPIVSGVIPSTSPTTTMWAFFCKPAGTMAPALQLCWVRHVIYFRSRCFHVPCSAVLPQKPLAFGRCPKFTFFILWYPPTEVLLPCLPFSKIPQRSWIFVKKFQKFSLNWISEIPTHQQVSRFSFMCNFDVRLGGSLYSGGIAMNRKCISVENSTSSWLNF